jgi:hypothetical protein
MRLRCHKILSIKVKLAAGYPETKYPVQVLYIFETRSEFFLINNQIKL